MVPFMKHHVGLYTFMLNYTLILHFTFCIILHNCYLSVCVGYFCSISISFSYSVLHKISIPSQSPSTGVCPSVTRPNVTGRCSSGIRQTRPSRQSSVDTDPPVPWRCCEVPVHVDLYTGSSLCCPCIRPDCCRSNTVAQCTCSKETTSPTCHLVFPSPRNAGTIVLAARQGRRDESVVWRKACACDTNPGQNSNPTQFLQCLSFICFTTPPATFAVRTHLDTLCCVLWLFAGST